MTRKFTKVSLKVSLKVSQTCGPEVLFETCVATKFVDNDDDDDDDDDDLVYWVYRSFCCAAS